MQWHKILLDGYYLLESCKLSCVTQTDMKITVFLCVGLTVCSGCVVQMSTDVNFCYYKEGASVSNGR